MTQSEYEKYLKEKDPCKKCENHNGYDCTKNPYIEGCSDPVIRQYWEERQQ